MKKLLLFIACVIICQSAGLIGAIFTIPAIPVWYAGLNKPSFNPPDWLFGPVWTALFLMMGIALYLLLRRRTEKQGTTVALMAFAAQLALNISWSVLFFGLKLPLAGLIWIIPLWLSIFITIIAFWRVTRAGALLLVPYIFWVSFAAILNFFIWRLN